MEDLQGFVFDESKCVTYKWLSTTLGVSADVSKRMLFEFVQANADKVSATYLVSGTVADGQYQRRRLQLVSQDKFKDLGKSGQFADINAAHVFSIAINPAAEGLKSPCSSSVLWTSEYDANHELYKVLAARARLPWMHRCARRPRAARTCSVAFSAGRGWLCSGPVRARPRTLTER